jgi:hypothetical protein
MATFLHDDAVLSQLIDELYARVPSLGSCLTSSYLGPYLKDIMKSYAMQMLRQTGVTLLDEALIAEDPSNPWIELTEGKCPLLPAGTRVQVKCADGWNDSGRAGDYEWKHGWPEDGAGWERYKSERITHWRKVVLLP